MPTGENNKLVKSFASYYKYFYLTISPGGGAILLIELIGIKFAFWGNSYGVFEENSCYF